MSANININNFVIDRIVSGTMSSTADGSILWRLTQIQNASLAMSSEIVDAVDAIGNKIMSFERAKEATFSAENAIFDIDLLAAQVGSTKEVGSEENKIKVPAYDTIAVVGSTITLSQTPLEDIPFIYVLRNDNTISEPFAAGESVTESTFTQEGTTINLPTGVTSGRVFIPYEYETANAVQVVNRATEFPKSGQFVLDILGADVCNPTSLIHAYLIFDNAKLSSSTDLSFDTEMAQGFEITASQAYCDTEKKLWRLVIPAA